MTFENVEHLARAKDLIERSRRELERLREDLRVARAVIDRSRKILSETEPNSEEPR
jgi:hypothetical protein